MERTTFGLLFYIRRDKINKRGEASVFIRLTINERRANVSIGCFEIIRRDSSKAEFLTRLNDLYIQFQRVGNNCNQMVRAVNSYLSNGLISCRIAALEQHICGLKVLSIEIRDLATKAEG